MGKTGASEGPERMAPPRQRLAPRMCRCPDDKNDGEKTKICLFGHLFGDFLFASLFFGGEGCATFFSQQKGDIFHGHFWSTLRPRSIWRVTKCFNVCRRCWLLLLLLLLLLLDLFQPFWMFISLQYFNHQKRDACFGYLLLAICLLLLLPLLLNRVAWKKSETKSSPGEKSENDNTLQSMGTLARIWCLVSHRKMWFAWAGFSQKKLPCNRLITPGGSRVGGKDAKVNLLCWSDFWWLRPPKVSWLIEDFCFSQLQIWVKKSLWNRKTTVGWFVEQRTAGCVADGHQGETRESLRLHGKVWNQPSWMGQCGCFQK